MSEQRFGILCIHRNAINYISSRVGGSAICEKNYRLLLIVNHIESIALMFSLRLKLKVVLRIYR